MLHNLSPLPAIVFTHVYNMYECLHVGMSQKNDDDDRKFTISVGQARQPFLRKLRVASMFAEEEPMKRGLMLFYNCSVIALIMLKTYIRIYSVEDPLHTGFADGTL